MPKVLNTLLAIICPPLRAVIKFFTYKKQALGFNTSVRDSFAHFLVHFLSVVHVPMEVRAFKIQFEYVLRLVMFEDGLLSRS